MNNVPIKQINTSEGLLEVVLFPLAITAEISDDDIHKILFLAMVETPNDMNVMSAIERIEIVDDEKIIYIRDSDDALDIEAFYYDFETDGPAVYYRSRHRYKPDETCWKVINPWLTPSIDNLFYSFRLVK